MVRAKAPLITWTELNARQQTYLKLLYQVDQETAREEKQWGRRRPASEWRWLLYGELTLNKCSHLKYLLQQAQLVDPGTGSTFEALERRKLIECSGTVPALEIKLTPLGRKVARVGLGELPPKRTPKGMFSKRAWEALTIAYSAGDEGLQQEWGFKYAGIHFKTWDWLQDYSEGSLVQEVYHPEDSTRSPRPYRIQVTSQGIKFYCDHWEHHRSLYPDIEGPEPRQSPALADQPSVNIAELVRRKRGNRGLRELAQEIGGEISPVTLSRIEHGKEVNLFFLKVICDWLKVPMPENN